MSTRLLFVPTGRRDYSKAVCERVRAEVEAEFAEQLANATWWQRIRLRRLMRKEIARRMPQPPSPSSLYGTQGR